ncbi:MAG TPA: hypothetical protein VMJ32_04850 [Pirellulales bacterium]|nr:hypothetical protein [Pirellulales bacterium]
MLQFRNISFFVAAGLLLIACSANLQADSQLPAHAVKNDRTALVKNASLLMNGDCCQTAPAPACGCKTYQPCITYRGCCDCCGPKVSQTLKVQDPCDCCCCPCVAEIPVCLPACCKDPKVCSECGLLGRGVVTYSYDCGCCVKIVFTRCGDVIVRYE